MSNHVFHLPDLGEGLTDADILEWYVAVGDTVVVDHIIATVETAKASVELPCPYAGVVAELHGQPGQTIPVGAPFITVTSSVSAGSSVSAPSAPAPSTPAEAAQARAVETYREEERAGSSPSSSGNVLIGRGTTEVAGRRRRRVVAASAQAAPAPAAPAQASAPAAPARPANTTGCPVAGPPGTIATATGAVRVISPLVRRLAAEHRVDLTTVAPSGPGGIITRADIDAAISRGTTLSGSATPAAGAAPAGAPAATPVVGVTVGVTGEAIPAPGTEVRIPITGVRRMIADKLSQSRREIPDATTWVDVDATQLVDARAQIAAVHPEANVGFMALLARMCVSGLRRFPELNARVDTATGEIVRLGSVNLSFAAQSPRGLVVPVVHDAQALTTAQLAAAIRELTAAARAGTLTPAQLTGGTFTLNNYGVYGVDGSTPIINHPEAAMLGVGRIMERPWAVGGQVVVRQITQLGLTFDHRVCDGGVSGGFIRYIADCIERPTSLLAGV